MTTRPRQFYIFSILLIMIALSFPAQIMVLYGHHWSETSAIFSKITGLNWLVMVGLLLVSYLYFHASRWLVVGAPLVVILVALNNYIVGKFAGDFSLLETSSASLVVGCLFMPLLMPSSQAILRNPTRRWWRTSKRFNKRVSATINPYVGDMIHSFTHDISQSGAFVCIDESREVPKVGESIRVILNVNSMKKIRCEAVVVRVTAAKGTYPPGIGIKFIDMEKNHYKSYQRFIES